MNDLVERVDHRLVNGFDVIAPAPERRAGLTPLCHDAPELWVCTQCCAGLYCIGCFEDHVDPDAGPHRLLLCDACGVEVGTDTRELFQPRATRAITNNVKVGGQVKRLRVWATFAMTGVVCHQDECVRALAEGYAGAAALPAEPGPVGSAIRTLESALAARAYGELPPAA